MYVYMNVCQKQCLYIMFVSVSVPCQETETSSDITSIPIYEADIGWCVCEWFMLQAIPLTSINIKCWYKLTEEGKEDNIHQLSSSPGQSRSNVPVIKQKKENHTTGVLHIIPCLHKLVVRYLQVNNGQLCVVKSSYAKRKLKS